MKSSRGRRRRINQTNPYKTITSSIFYIYPRKVAGNQRPRRTDDAAEQDEPLLEPTATHRGQTDIPVDRAKSARIFKKRKSQQTNILNLQERTREEELCCSTTYQVHLLYLHASPGAETSYHHMTDSPWSEMR